jgi:hypothetical protein
MSTAAFEILGTARPFGLPRVRWIAGIVGATIGCTCALMAGFVMQPAYRASIVLTVVRDNDRVDLASAIGSQLGSLASLTGIGSAASNDRAEAVSLLGSRYLARSFIERYKLLPALADAMRGPMSLTDEPPTLELAVKSLGSDVIAIDDDRRMGIIERVVMLRGAWDQFASHPWLGDAVVERTTRSYPHNMFLEAGMSIGVVGLTCMAAFATTALAAAVRSFRAGWEFAWLAVVYLIHLVASVVSGSIIFSYPFWAAAIAVLVADRVRRPLDAAPRGRAIVASA